VTTFALYSSRSFLYLEREFMCRLVPPRSAEVETKQSQSSSLETSLFKQNTNKPPPHFLDGR
jgi:hypothetical protein